MIREKPTETLPNLTEVIRVHDQDDLSAEGKGDEVVTQGMWLALMNLIATLKARREQMGLTITEVAKRSRLTVVTVSRLENLHNRNPSLDTVFRRTVSRADRQRTTASRSFYLWEISILAI